MEPNIMQPTVTPTPPAPPVPVAQPLAVQADPVSGYKRTLLQKLISEIMNKSDGQDIQDTIAQIKEAMSSYKNYAQEWDNLNSQMGEETTPSGNDIRKQSAKQAIRNATRQARTPGTPNTPTLPSQASLQATQALQNNPLRAAGMPSPAPAPVAPPTAPPTRPPVSMPLQAQGAPVQPVPPTPQPVTPTMPSQAQGMPPRPVPSAATPRPR